jgi:hypothetical protein
VVTTSVFDDLHEEFYGKIMLTLSTLSFLESAEVSANLFSRLETVAPDWFREIASLKDTAAVAWRQAFDQITALLRESS